MGCFLSKKRPTKPDNKIRGGGAPPPPPPEEEAVKEVVLSETSILRKPTLSEDAAAAVWKNENLPPENHEFKVESVPDIPQKVSTVEIKPSDGEDFISEQSEMCSYTESFSTTTTATATALEKKDDDGEEVTQRSPLKTGGRRKRPNNGDSVVGARERNVRSPARRPSPEKRKPVSQGRGMSTGPRRNLGPRRSEGGEVSGRRRSRSPVTGGGNVMMMMHKSSAGGVKVIGGTAEYSHRTARAVEKVQSGSDGVPAESSGGKVEKQKDKEEERESLDNPLVSLECFIFL